MCINMIGCLALLLGSVSSIVSGGAQISRRYAVVTNDFTMSDFNSWFKKVETTPTNVVLTFKDDIQKLYREISEADEVNVCRGGDVVLLRTDQKLFVGDGRHVKLEVRGFANDDAVGFELIQSFDARSFGRGVSVRYGRLLCSPDRKVRDGDVVIIGASELNRAGEKSNVDPVRLDGLRKFFREYVDTYNIKDVDKLEQLAGDSFGRLMRWMDAGELLGGVEVRCCHGSDVIEVSTEVTLLGRGDDPYTFPVVFKMRENANGFFVEDMLLSPADGGNRALDSAVDASEKLVAAINERDIQSVGNLLYDCKSGDLDKALLDRGLSWIKEAIDHKVEITQRHTVVRCASGGRMVGEVPVPCRLGGTNIVRRVVSVGAKIKCGDDGVRRCVDMSFPEWLKNKYDKDKECRER